jgi:group I intron endonuclease
MFIYKITNTENNKVYIGQTIRPIKQRFQRHINDALNNIIDTHLARAIRKYGKESFEISLIDTAESQDELNKKEQYWIKQYNSTNSNIGYNETDAIYKSGGNTYMSKTKEEMEQISQKIRDSKIGSKNPNHKKVKCFNVETNQELFFDSVKQCQNYFNESNHRFITTRVLFNTKSLYKGKWKIAYQENDYPNFNPQIIKHGKQIKVENLINHNIKAFPSIRKAAEILGISRAKFSELKNNPTIIIDNLYRITILN